MLVFFRSLNAKPAALLASACLGLFLAACSQTPMNPGVPAPGGSGLTLVDRNGDASMLRLADGSVWQIQPAGQAVTLTWQRNEPLEIVKASHPAYPYVLTNLRTGQGCRARRTR